MITFLLNGREIATKEPAGKTLLDFLREDRRLTAAKPSCRMGDCGACLALLGGYDGQKVRYVSVNSCLLPLGEAAGRHVVTLEGLNGPELSPIQEALMEEGGVQCGYCTPGLVMALTGYFLSIDKPREHEALEAVSGNLCRCTGYAGIRRAIRRLCVELDTSADQDGRIEDLIKIGMVPDYFRDISLRLNQLPASEMPTAPGQAVKLGGGTDLFVRHPEHWAHKPLAFLSRKAPLQGIWEEESRIYIASETTMEEIRASPLMGRHFPGLTEDLRLIAALPVRHRATLAGNLANASPIADLAVYFLAHGALLGLKQGRGLREIKLADFFLGYKKIDLRPDEEIEWLSIEPPAKPFFFSFEKVSRRIHLDIAAANSALRLEMAGDIIEMASLSAGGVAPIPLLLRRTGEYLRGRKLNIETVVQAATLAQEEISPISDVRGSAEYKSLLLRQLVFGHFLKLFPDRIRAEELP